MVAAKVATPVKAPIESMDWILRFVDALFKGLNEHCVRIDCSKRNDDPTAVLRLEAAKSSSCPRSPKATGGERPTTTILPGVKRSIGG